MLIEVHIIQNHAPSNLNRDDSGSPKSAIFGGYRRARLSSQCQKRCFRTSETFIEEVDGTATEDAKRKNPARGTHTTSMPDEVEQRARAAGVSLNDEQWLKIKKTLVTVIKKGEGGGGIETNKEETTEGAGTGEVDKAKAQRDKLKTAQAVFWRESELQALVSGVTAWASGDQKHDFDAKAALKPAGLSWNGITVDMALFGRMVTSELMHNVEASSQFAHAISTHEWAREFDMWTRVDDRRDKRLDYYHSAFGVEEKLESGTDGMGDQEFTSACYYSYFNVNFEALVDNLTGKSLKHDLDDSADRNAAVQRACDAVAGLVKAAILERPTGKFNSMATPSLPSLVLVEVRDSHIPVSYVNAFAKPVDPKNQETQNEKGQIERVDLTQESAKRLIVEANRINKAFSRKAKSYVFSGGHELEVALIDGVSVHSVDDLIKNLRGAISGSKAANG